MRKTTRTDGELNLSESKPDPDEGRRVSRVYDRYARSGRKRRAWSSANPGNVAIRRELLERLLSMAEAELRSDGRVLDLGCGSGWCMAELAARGVAPERLIGVDVQVDRIARAARVVPGATLLAGDARALELPDESASLVLMITLLSSLASAADVRAALAEVRRVLVVGGLALCYEPRLPNPLNPSTRLIRRRELVASGFRIEAEETLTVLPWLARTLGARPRPGYEALARIPALRSHRLIAAR